MLRCEEGLIDEFVHSQPQGKREGKGTIRSPSSTQISRLVCQRTLIRFTIMDAACDSPGLRLAFQSRFEIRVRLGQAAL